MTSKEHWEQVYNNKQPDQVSWTQDIPQRSLYFLHTFNLPKSASIIDIGGGDSRFVDHLIVEGYEDITVLDISATALERAKVRLGENASQVNWVVSDVTEFAPVRSFDLWHDRATFHFLTNTAQIDRYLETAYRASNRFLTLGTFSTEGPEKCSGLEVCRYDQNMMEERLAGRFERVECVTEDHTTPFGTTQNFLFCSFEKVQ